MLEVDFFVIGSGPSGQRARYLSGLRQRLAACYAFGHTVESMSGLFPYGSHSVPEIPMVGRHEEELTTAAVPYETDAASYREIARGVMSGEAAPPCESLL